MTDLFPSIQPYVRHSLQVDSLHTLYVEECGNPAGIPAVFLHGGPGAGCEPYHRCFFDPQRYRIVLFDQRGAGRSVPHAELQDNDTQALLRDMEHIRQHLEIDQWLILGGSWGSTLALLYAETYPERVLGLILRGIFLCRPKDIHWFYQHGASEVLPDHWEEFLEPIPQAERSDLVGAYYKRLNGEDEVTRMATAKAWSLWEARAATLQPNPDLLDHLGDPFTALSMARIECHYFMHNAFLDCSQILRDAHRLHSLPATIIHGRYDLVCPLENAWILHQAWPQAQLQIIPDAGHAATELGIRSALVEATQAMAERLA